jgi:hypothetical protein
VIRAASAGNGPPPATAGANSKTPLEAAHELDHVAAGGAGAEAAPRPGSTMNEGVRSSWKPQFAFYVRPLRLRFGA